MKPVAKTIAVNAICIEVDELQMLSSEENDEVCPSLPQGKLARDDDSSNVDS